MATDSFVLAVPIIHLNGTSAQSLKDDLDAAYDAISVALEKLRQCAPNGRDYYPQPGLMNEAIGQHHWRMRRLTIVQDEITAIMDAIDEQGK